MNYRNITSVLTGSLPFLGLIGCALYSWIMTASGLFYSGYIPQSFISNLTEASGLRNGSDVITAFIAAAIVQSGIFVVYLSFSLSSTFFKRTNIISIPIFILLILFSGFVSCFSVLLNSRGESLERGFENRIASVNREVAILDAQMIANFAAQLASFRSLAEQSKRGQDSTGIAICGDICKRNIDKARHYESKYGPNISPPLQSLLVEAESDISKKFADLRALRAALGQKFASYTNYCIAEDRACPLEQMTSALNFIDRNMTVISSSMLNAPPNRNLLILNKTSEVYFRPWLWLVPEFNLVIPLLIAFLPDLVSILMTLTARAQVAGDWRRAAAKAETEQEDALKDELAAVKNRTGTKEKIANERLKEEMADATIESIENMKKQ